MFTLPRYVVPCAVLAAWLVSGCGPKQPSVPEYILDARRPNNTKSKFLKPPDEHAAPTSADATLLLFIHGIFGDTVDTWKRTNGKSLATIILERPEFADRFDAFAYGFPSSIVKQGSFSTPEAAKTLESDLRFYQLTTKYRQIVIVAHSMGGLVALEALTTYPALRAKVPLVVTYGTPYNGAQITRLGKEILDNQAILDMQVRDGGNSFLQSLSSRWKQVKAGDGPKTKVTCAYEKVPLPLLGLVVQETSGTSLCDGVADPIADDHILMVKPDADNHGSVKVLTNALRDLLDEQVSEWSPLYPLPNRIPPALGNSPIGSALLGKESPVGPSARAEIDQRRKQFKFFPPTVDRFLYFSPRYSAATPRRLELLPGLDAVMSVMAVDDTRQVANVLDDPRTVASSFEWPGNKNGGSVRFVVLLFPLTLNAATQIDRSTDIGGLIKVR